MPTLKEYNAKINRLRSTRKMTRTMKMVSANKLRKAQEAQRHGEEFRRRFDALVLRLLACVEDPEHPLLSERPLVRRIHCMVITSDRGLCGGFNNNLNRKVAAWIAERSDGSSIEMSFCGRRGYLFFRKMADERMHFEGVSLKPAFAEASHLGQSLQTAFVDGHYDEVYLAYNMPKGALSQVPVIERLLPLKFPSVSQKDATSHGGCLLEPDQVELLQCVLSKYVGLRLYDALLRSSVAEHAARMNAMENSTVNAGNLIDRYTLYRNRARQAAITRELIEIVGGAETLK